jgi:hypothetical protein
VIKASESATKEGFLLPVDAVALIEKAKASKVLR